MTAAITEAGIYDGIPEDQYHSDPALSSTGSRKLLPPSCPAIYRYEQDHPVYKREFDYGSAAHKLVLGTGPAISLVDAKDWRTKAAQEAQADARAKGFIPLLVREFDRVKAMAAAIQDHPYAGPLFDPLSGGRAEQSGWWFDEEFGVWCRVRFDWLGTQRTSDGRPIIADYKTAVCAQEDVFSRKSAGEYGYHQQDAWYSDAYQHLMGEEPAFIFVVQEKTPPYLVNIVQFDHDDRQIGRERNRNALERFRDCSRSGIWPGYGDDIKLITLPPWQRTRGDDLL